MLNFLRTIFVPKLIVGTSETASPTISSGTDSPEGVVTAPIGSLYMRSNGTTDTAVYKKEAGVGNTGWIAIAAGSGGGGAVMGRGFAVVNFATARHNSSFAVTGQTLISETAIVTATVVAITTGDNLQDEITIEAPSITIGNVVAGTGFTIFATSTELLKGDYRVNWIWSN